MNYNLPKILVLCSLLLCSIRSSAVILTNANSITINDNAPASLYPSTLAVSGLSGTITSISVKINGLSHSWVHDVSFILQAPTGQSLLLQSGTADGLDASNLTYTISDAGLTQFDEFALWNNNGTYKPTSYFWDMWDAPAPPTPPGAGTYSAPGPFGPQTATLSSVFNGLAPNGTWKLFVADFASGDAGIISGGWTLDITTGVPMGLDLKTFFGSKIDQNNRLGWETQNEINFSHFEVEYSTDNKHFEKIADVNSYHDLATAHQYEYIHNNVAALDNYYRLKMIDQDQVFNYSKTIYIRNIIQKSGITISPNIVQNECNITSESDRISSILIHDFSGRCVFSATPSSYSYSFLRSAFPIMPGLYIVSIYSEGIKLKSEYLNFQ